MVASGPVVSVENKEATPNPNPVTDISASLGDGGDPAEFTDVSLKFS